MRSACWPLCWMCVFSSTGCTDYELRSLNLLIVSDDTAVAPLDSADEGEDPTTEDTAEGDDSGTSVIEEDDPRAEEPIYLNTNTQLWSWDPDEPEPQFIGVFHGVTGNINAMTDIAIDEDGQMYGCTYNALFRINPLTAESTFIGSLPLGTTGLTFLYGDVLIAAGDGIFSIYSEDGGLRSTLVPAGVQETAGDIVGVPGALLHWVVLDPNGGFDQLAVLNTITGAVILAGGLGNRGVWGLAYAYGELYGFTSDGRWMILDPEDLTDGTVSVTTGSFESHVSWWGATTNPVRW